MKRIITILALCILAGGLLSLVSWQVRKSSKADSNITQAVDDPATVDLPAFAENKKPKPWAYRVPKQFADDRERRIWENTPDDWKAIEQAHADGNHEEFYRLGMEMAAKMPWEWDPPPWVKKIREENGWTNPPVFIDLPPYSKEESAEKYREMQEYFDKLREWQKSPTGEMPPPPRMRPANP